MEGLCVAATFMDKILIEEKFNHTKLRNYHHK
jgi:hypothetical protein